MKSTINNTSSEVSNNQILHAGFDLFNKPEGTKLTKSCIYNNMIIFILGGSLKINSPHIKMKFIEEPYMLFLKMFDNCTYEIAPCSKVLLFTFDSLTIDELLSFQAKYDLLPESTFEWIELKIIEPLYSFLKLLIQYQENNYLDYKLYASKRDEMFYLLKRIYTKEELGNFFYLLVNHTTDFETCCSKLYESKECKRISQLDGIRSEYFPDQIQRDIRYSRISMATEWKSKTYLKMPDNKRGGFQEHNRWVRLQFALTFLQIL